MNESISDREIFGDDEIGGFLSGIGKAVAGVGKSVVRAGGHASKIPGLLIHAKIQKAGKQAAAAVSRVTDNPLIQAGHWPLIVPNLVVHAAKGGPKSALEAAHRTVKNPLIKAEVAAAGVLFPPVAPFSAAAIAGAEAAARVHDAMKSGDPKKIAAAALKVAATAALAKAGNPDAARGLAALNKVGGTMNLVRDLQKGVPAAKKAASAVNAKGGSGKSLAQIVSARAALQNQKNPDPKVRAAAHKALTAIQQKSPGLLAGVQAAMRVPEKVQLGRFAVLRTGRILLDGKPIRKASKKPASHAHAHAR